MKCIFVLPYVKITKHFLKELQDIFSHPLNLRFFMQEFAGGQPPVDKARWHLALQQNAPWVGKVIMYLIFDLYF